MVNIAARLDTLLREARVPIHGVSIGRRDDPTSWRIGYTADATEPQRRAGDAILAAFDVAAEENMAAGRLIEEQLKQPLVRAMLQAFAPVLGRTPEECKELLRVELLKSGQ